MTGNIVGEPFDEFVRDQINIRQSNQFGGYNSLRTDDQLKYLNNRNAWVKLASSVNILADATQAPTPPNTILNSNPTGITSPTLATSTPLQIQEGRTVKLGESKLKNIGFGESEVKNYLGTKLAEKAILFNTLSSFDPISKSYSTPRAGVSNTTDLWNNFAYGLGGTNFGIQPPPGIISATVDSLNRGSIRKASVTLKAHNKFQFDIIELLYLRLGFTMMLEWGWDKYLDNTGTLQQIGNTIIEEEWFTSNGTTQFQMLTNIQKKRKDYQGNYDGFFGKVSNFTWSFNPDGSYDISIDLITLGDVIESLKANTSVKEKFYSRENGIESEAKFPNDSPLSKTNIAKVSTLNTIGYFLYKKIEEYGVNLKLGPDVDLNFFFLYRVLFPKDTKTSATQYYIKLDELFSQLESLIIPKVQNDGNNFTSQIEFQKTGNLISYFPNQIPLDPRVCIFQPPLNSYGDITGITPPSYLNSPTIKPYTVSSNGHTYGILTNLYINFEFIAGLLTANGGPDQELSLFKFLQDLCNGINDALGGVNKLEPIIKDDYKITIIDQTLSSPDVESQSTANLEVYGYNPDSQTSNFVKDIKFISKITPQLASTISIGATAAGSSVSEIDGTAFSKWSEGLVDRFTKEILEPDGFSQLQQNQKAQQEKENRKKYQEDFAEFTLADRSAGALFKEAIDSFQTGFVKIFGFFNPHAIAENVERDNDVNERRIIRDPFNKSLDGLPMYFEEYYSEIIKLEEQKLKNNIYKADDISELVSTNYAIYLAKAFGGSPNDIKVEYVGRTANQIITGLGSATSFENSRATVENLTISELESRYQEFDDTFISQGKSAYKTYINNLNNIRYINKQIASSEIGFIPLSFELVLDGISGIKIYQKLNINNTFLPSNYPESLKFIITKVNHSISNNSWDTSLSTISIPVTEPYPSQLPNAVPSLPTSTSTSATTLIQQQEFKGKLQPLKNMIGAYESNSNYDIANIGGNAKISKTKVSNLSFTELRKFQSLPEGDPNRVFAAGKYQIIPKTLYGENWKTDINGGLFKKLGLNQNDKFSEETQEKIGDGLFLIIRKNAENYLSGKNSGNETDLEKAIQDIGQEFASMPVIYSKTNQKIGDVRTGSGQLGFYGGTGANPNISKLGVKEMARVLIQTRINYSNKAPVFVPIYFNL
jgi:hypothetical protein